MSDRAGTRERPLLSLTMIVRNEQEKLARCLASVRSIADELIVVDTGSTDRTVEIARAHGAAVHFFAWCDDFAAARNEALRHATGAWCLHLDADEVLIEREPGALRAELERQPEGRVFLRVPVKNLMSGGLGHMLYGGNRLYRNRPGVRWARPIHENVMFLADGAPPDLEGSCASAEIEHDGYADPSPERAKRRNRRNTRILRRWQAAHPDDYGSYYYLAVEAHLAGNLAAALRWARRGIELFKDRIRPDFVGALYCQAIKAASMSGRHRLAIRLGVEGVRHYAFSEICYLLAGSYLAVKDFANAEKYFEMAMSLRSRFSEYQMEVGTGSWKALIGLGAVAWERGDYDQAIERARRVTEWVPEEGLGHCVLGKALLANGRPREAEASLRRAVELAPMLHEAHLRLSQALVLQERPQEACDHLDGRVADHPEVDHYWLWLGELLYEYGELEKCVAVLGAAIERHQSSAAIYERLGQALRRLGRHQDSLNAYALASALDPKSRSARAGLGFAAQLVEWSDALSRNAPGSPAEAVAG